MKKLAVCLVLLSVCLLPLAGCKKETPKKTTAPPASTSPTGDTKTETPPATTPAPEPGK